MPTESRIQTTNKTRDIFYGFIGTRLLSGIICSKCNINLLTYDAFQKEIQRKHEELIKVKSEKIEVPMETDKEEFITGIVFEEADEEEATVTVSKLLEPAAQPSTSEPQNGSSAEDDDENDVICIPQEPQVPIDLDSISDEPAEPKQKVPDEILYKCDHCSAVSSKKEVIVQHIKQSHSHKCEQCGKVYPKQERLDAHVARVHNVGGGNKRKQALGTVKNDEQLRFRLKQKPYGRPWPSVLAKRKEEWGY